MNLGKTPPASIFTVNGHLLHAFLLGGLAWWLWPSSPEWWGFGLLSIILGAAAFGKSIEALRAMVKIYGREKELARLAATISRAIGETLVQQHSLGLNSGVLDYTANISTGKDRLISAERLMRMKPNEQLIHVKNVGWILCLKVGQHQTAPFCHGELADNPHEGPQLSPDPKVTIQIEKAYRQ